MPYELKPRDIERRFFICEQLIQRQQRKGFLHRIMIGDEKWIFYNNPKKKKYYAKLGQSLPSTSASTPRPNIHGSKIMLCIWWFHYGRSVSATIRLSRTLREKRSEYEQRHDKVILLHDNARPYVANVAKKNIWKCSNGMFYGAPAVFSGHCSF